MLQTRVAEEPSPYKPNRLAGAVSSLNPDAVRGPNGIWNEESLPVLEWEAAVYRVVVPAQLQQSLVLRVPPVLRWSTKKYLDVMAKHHIKPEVVADLSRFLDGWAFHGEETGSYRGNQRVLFQDDGGRWYALSIGADRSGSYNAVTLISSSDPSFVGNRLRTLERIVERRKSDP